MKLAAQRRDGFRGGWIDTELPGKVVQQRDCSGAGLAKALAQSPQRIARPCDGWGARHQTVMETEAGAPMDGCRQQPDRRAVTSYSIETSETRARSRRLTHFQPDG